MVFVMTLLMLVVMIRWAAGEQKDSPLLLTEEDLYREIGDGNFLKIAGTVTQCSASSLGIRLYLNQISVLSESNSELSFLPEQRITMISENEEIMPGDRIVVRGTYAPFLEAANPGQFDFHNWYFSQKTVCALKSPIILEIQKGSVNIGRILWKLQSIFRRSYEAILPAKAAGIITAITLGDKGLMETEWKTTYQEGGIAHIIAVSGLHITLIGMSLYRFLRKCYLPFWISALFSGGFVWLYVLMTGSGISALRAAVMFDIWLGAQVCGRKYDRITSATAAAALLTLSDTKILGESSFWLSFSAIWSLAVLVPQMQAVAGQAMEALTGAVQRNGWMSRVFFTPAVSSLGVWMGMLPVTIYFFYQAVPWSILINLAVIPLMSLVMFFGILSAVAGMLNITAGMFLAAPMQYLLVFFEILCKAEQKLPCCLWVAGRPAIWSIALYYSFLGGILAVTVCQKSKKSLKNRKRNQRRISIWILVAWIGFAVAGPFILRTGRQGRTWDYGEEMEILCLDVGQGDGALIRLPGDVHCLMDGGSSSERSLWYNRIGQCIKYYGIDTLDYIFLSHGDADHTSGVLEFLTNYERGFGGKNVHGITVKHLVLPPTADLEDFSEIKKLARQQEISVLQMDAGDSIERTAMENPSDKSSADPDLQNISWQICCLAPCPENLTGDKNEDSLVLLIQYGDFEMLFTGDLEGESEMTLVKKLKTQGVTADILKVGHHGSANATSEAFLDALQLKAAVISCGKNNSYGHPASETLERLAKAGVQFFVTSEVGAVQIKTDGQEYKIYTFKK